MDIQDVKNKEPLIKEFYIWLFQDERITNKNINLQSEEDISLASFYCDSKIYYPEQIASFFETKSMKRLAKVSQLDIAINEYPSAYHSRLEHSKGVYNRKLEEFLLNFENPSWKEYIESNNLRLYLLAELIKMAGHDIGHFPLSHSFEENIFNKYGIHEIVGRKILLEDPEIQKILNSISPELHDALKTLFEKDILNFSSHDEGNFDVDRLDFIGRDSLYCGKLYNSKTIPYQTVHIKVDSQGNPITNEDSSIKLDDCCLQHTIDVYDYSQLRYIEEFLQLRFNNYRKIYMSPKIKLGESALQPFFNIFLSEKQEVGKELYNYINYLKSVNPEDIDISEFQKWDEIRFYSQIIEIAQNHNNKNVRDLATILMPPFNQFLYLIKNLLKSSDYSEQDLKFLQTIKEVIKGDTEFSRNIRNQNFLFENSMILSPSNISSLTLDKKYVHDFKYQLNGYNPQENPIYIKDKFERIFELAHHPEKSRNWKNYSEVLNIPCIYLPDLRYHNVPESQIQSLISQKNQPTQIKNEPLKTGQTIEDLFLEL